MPFAAVLTGSIGISVYPDDAQDCEGLLKHADVAMYRAKDTGRNCVVRDRSDADAVDDRDSTTRTRA